MARFALAAITVIVVTTLALLAFDSQRETAAVHGGADFIGLDMDPDVGGADENTGTSVGAIQTCAQINQNESQDADEDAVDTVQVDIVIENIPASNPAITTNAQIDWTATIAPNLTVAQSAGDNSDLLYATAAGWNILDASDTTPQTDGDFLSTIVDFNATGTTGSGTIHRLNISANGSVPAGVYALTLSGAAHIDTAGDPYAPHVVGDALIAIDAVCTAITPSPSPSPSPTPSPSPISTPTPTPTASPPPTPTPTAPPTTATPTATPTATATPTTAATPTPTAGPSGLPPTGGSSGGTDVIIPLLAIAGATLLAVGGAVGYAAIMRRRRGEL